MLWTLTLPTATSGLSTVTRSREFFLNRSMSPAANEIEFIASLGDFCPYPKPQIRAASSLDLAKAQSIVHCKSANSDDRRGAIVKGLNTLSSPLPFHRWPV